MAKGIEDLLCENGFIRAAVITAWSALESAMRMRMRAAGEPAGWGTEPREMLNELYSSGLLASDEFNHLERLYQVRNQIVHGFVSPSLDGGMVAFMAGLARRFVEESRPVKQTARWSRPSKRPYARSSRGPLNKSGKGNPMRKRAPAALQQYIVLPTRGLQEDRSPVDFPGSDPMCIAVTALGRKGTFPKGCFSQDAIAPPYGTDTDNFIGAFSNIGPEVNLTAPGVGIVSTVPGGFIVMDGTSMASPATVGVAAPALPR